MEFMSDTVWDHPEELAMELIRASEIRWKDKYGYTARGIAIKKLWFEKILVLSLPDKELLKIRLSDVTDYTE
jgi:hypothetical protein